MSDATQRAEERRTSDHRRALIAMKLLASPLEAPDPVAVIDAKLGQLATIFGREWEEFAGDAQTIHSEASEALHAARGVSADLEVKKAVEVEEATVKCEWAHVAAAAAEQKRQDDIRAATVAHQRRVNVAAIRTIVEAMAAAHSGSAEEAGEIARAIVSAIVLEKIPGVSIKY